MAALPFSKVDLGSLAFGTMIKDTSVRLFVVPIEPALRVQTTPVEISSLEDDDVPFAYIRPHGALRTFLEKTEKTIEDACIANKEAWFAVAKSLDDDTLRRGFKSFFDADKGFKVKVPADVPCFDADRTPIGREGVPAGSVVRIILEMSRVCFGRHEYGSSWKIVQVQLVPTECLIETDPLDDSMTAVASDSDVDEFI